MRISDWEFRRVLFRSSGGCARQDRHAARWRGSQHPCRPTQPGHRRRGRDDHAAPGPSGARRRAGGHRARRQCRDAGSGRSVMTPSMRLAVIAGDGIGPEVIREALKVLDAVLPGVEKTEYDLGARQYTATGEVLPDSVLAELK